MPDEPVLVVDAHAFIGEGPVWDPRIGRLAWVDIMEGRLHLTAPSGETTTLTLPSAVGAVALRASGGWVAALADGFWSVADDGTCEPLALVDHGPELRFNDGKCDPAGRFWAGTMGLGFEPGVGALYRLDADHSVHRMLSDVTISNGLDWSHDGRTMYYIDTPTLRIDTFEFDVERGEIADRRLFATIEAGAGTPDGLTVDADGFIWVALWDGWRVRRYDPDGAIEREIRLPCSEVSCPGFGGDDLGDLYLTTAWQLFDEAQRAREPHAGGLYRVRPGITGRPAVAYAG